MKAALARAATLGLLTVRSAADAMVGTNIGGWMVLEPWITPSLFYRFLGNSRSQGVGMDSYTFCKALGPVEGNKVMRAHWDAWVTEDHIKALADRHVEIVRLPIGDWTTTSYGPYVGCMDGAADKIEWFLDTAAKYGLKILLDVHALKDSQNGFDNSGQTADLMWTDEMHFKHWSVQNATWMGHWNGVAYDSINFDNIEWAVNNVRQLMLRWGKHPAVFALEPVNEPWWNSDIPTLKDFYRQVRAVIREINPEVTFVFHDAFRTEPDLWNDLFPDDDIQHTAVDTHQYMAWWGRADTIQSYCDGYTAKILGDSIQRFKYDVWVGEWSLATDVCAFWLGGFNDGNTDPQFDCAWVDCPTSYLPPPHAVDFDRTAPTLGPFGESMHEEVRVRSGQCPVDSAFFSDGDVQALGDCTIAAFDAGVDAQFMWTFRNELEPRWEYVRAYDRGWISGSKYRRRSAGGPVSAAL